MIHNYISRWYDAVTKLGLKRSVFKLVKEKTFLSETQVLLNVRMCYDISMALVFLK